MKLILTSFAVLAISFTDVKAENWQVHLDDRPFPADELADLSGRSFVFYDDGEALFGKNGAYAYTFGPQNGGGTSWGTYYIAEDGSVCVDFANGMSRCDMYVRNAGRIVLITGAGERFPVRP